MNGRTALAAFIIALAALPVGAQETDEPEGWVCGGPWGGLVFSLRTDPAAPGRLLARTVGGAFLEEGGRWRKVCRPGAVPWEHVSLKAGRFWSVWEGRVFSSPNGRDWRAEGALGISTFECELLPMGQDRLLAACAYRAGDRVRLAVLTRSEGKWSETGHALVSYPRPEHLSAHFSRLIVHPRAPAEIRYFVQLTRYEDDPPRSHLLMSSDGGKSWTHHSSDHSVNAVAWDPADPSILFAVDLDWVADRTRLLRSDDGGKTFRTIGDDFRLAKIRALAVAEDGKGLLLGTWTGSVLQCDPDGGNVVEIGGGLPKAHVSALLVDRDRREIIAGTQVGVWRSEGGTFRRTSEGLAGIQAVGLVNLADGRLGCFGYHEGLRISSDGGRTWMPRPSRMAHRLLEVHALGQTILAKAYPHDRSLHRATFDGGRSWAPVRVDGEPIGIGAGRIYARGRNDRLMMSRDGVRWRTLPSPLPEYGTVFRPWSGPILLAGRERVFYLDDTTAETLSTVQVPGETILSLVVPDPLIPDVVYLFGNEGTVFRLEVLAGKLKAVFRGEQGFGGLSSDPERPDRRYLAIGNAQFVVSDDSGLTWRPLEPPPPFHAVRNMAVSAGRLVVAADGAVHSIALTEIP